jgi:bifunctional non-homologous end joining protein LigD
MKVIKSTTLYYREGSSDKVYNVSIEEEKGAHRVNFSYGRRGNTLITGTKTNSPVSLDKALVIYGKLVSEKVAKGYTEDVAGRTFTGIPQVEAKKTGVLPQLLNEIEESEIEKYINDPEWCAQEKYDGVRRMIIKTGSDVVGTNRKGLALGISQEIVDAVNLVADQDFILDGEAIGDTIVVFDCPVYQLPFTDRYKILLNNFVFDEKILKLAPTAWTTKEKADLYNRLKKGNAEGIVFKKINSEYTAGRPNSGGTQLKFKFCATATCMVDKVNTTKRSVSLIVFQGNNIVEVGNVTVYPNQSIPEKGAIVEVKYLYYFPGGSLFQPVLLGERDDVGKDACVYKQLKAKRELEEV